MSVDPQADEEGDEEGSESAYVYCVTCGHELPSRRAIKHMHSCFNKVFFYLSFTYVFSLILLLPLRSYSWLFSKPSIPLSLLLST